MRTLAALALSLAVTSIAPAQTSLTGAELAFQSDGTPDGKLERNGYVGTFIKVEHEGDVMLTARASGTSADATPASMRLVVVDDELAGPATPKESTLHVRSHLPPGTYFVRVQLENAPLADQRTLTVAGIEVSGAVFANQNTDANALAAADAYIEHFRKGAAKVRVAGVEPGTQVHLKLKRHAFNFGVAVSGYEKSIHMDADAPAGSDAAVYQTKVRELFNLIVPGNAGKWIYNEKDRGTPTMQYIDQLRAFAKENGQRMRMHTLLWDTDQQPVWVRELIKKAVEGATQEEKAAAKKELRQAISDRIKYYIAERAGSYVEMDILNEAYHQPRYWKIFGPDGIADIFKEADAAVKAAGATTRLYVNEYNIFQWSSTPPYDPKVQGKTDLYANWYREHVEQIRAAGGPVTGIGVQYYTDVRPDIPQPHSAARMIGVLENLRVTGLPISLTEFGVNRLPQRPIAPTKEQTDAALQKAAQAISETARLSFGTPGVDTFICWGFWAGDVWEQAPYGVLFDKSWNPTPAGDAYLALRKQWETDVTLPVAADGTVSFNGFFGDYELSAGDRKAMLSLKRDEKSYTVELR